MPHEDSLSTGMRCPACQGRLHERNALATWADEGFLAGFERIWLGAACPRGGRCPICRTPMLRGRMRIGDTWITLERCAACDVIWSDRDVVRAIPISARERERRSASFADVDLAPSLPWPLQVLTLFGFPVESPAPVRLGVPFVTWGVAAAMVLVTVLASGDLEQAIARFGLVWSDPFRDGGITWLSSFFLHAGWIHLLGNLYFLLVFGNDVEHELGRVRYVALVFGSALCGDLVAGVLDPLPGRPSVGASGGISGVLGFYALAFSRRQIYVNLWYWSRFSAWGIPALWLFGYWVAVQLLIAFQQTLGVGRVSGLAHLGGALGGVFAWWSWQRRSVVQ